MNIYIYMSSSKITQEIFKSRNNILDLLKKQAYNTEDYEGYSIPEVHTLVQNKQLDMLLSKGRDTDTGKKNYVKYHLGKSLRIQDISNYIEDLFTYDNILEKTDTLTIITKDPPNDTLITFLKNTWFKDNIFITVFSLTQLQFNILNHELVSPHTILSSDEASAFNKQFHIRTIADIPEISRFDPVAKAIGIKPDQICKIIRPSKTAITSNFYRICKNI